MLMFVPVDQTVSFKTENFKDNYVYFVQYHTNTHAIIEVNGGGYGDRAPCPPINLALVWSNDSNDNTIKNNYNYTILHKNHMSTHTGFKKNLLRDRSIRISLDVLAVFYNLRKSGKYDFKPTLRISGHSIMLKSNLNIEIFNLKAQKAFENMLFEISFTEERRTT